MRQYVADGRLDCAAYGVKLEPWVERLSSIRNAEDSALLTPAGSQRVAILRLRVLFSNLAARECSELLKKLRAGLGVAPSLAELRLARKRELGSHLLNQLLEPAAPLADVLVSRAYRRYLDHYAHVMGERIAHDRDSTARSAGPLGCAGPYLGLFVERHRPRMAGSGPRSQQQENARVCEGLEFVSLLGWKLHQSPQLSIDRLAGVAGDPYLTVDDGDPGSLVDLMVLKQLAGREVEYDGASLLGRGEDLRLMWLPGKAFEIPTIHQVASFAARQAAQRPDDPALASACESGPTRTRPPSGTQTAT